MRVRKCTIFSLWALASILPLLYIGFDISWLIKETRPDQLQTMMMIFQISYLLIFLLASVLYMMSVRMIKNMREQVNNNSNRDINLLLITFCFLFVNSTLLWMAYLNRLLTEGYYNKLGLIAISIKLALFQILKLQLFAILARFSFQLKLKNQVLESGKVLLIAYDEHNREILKVVM